MNQGFICFLVVVGDSWCGLVIVVIVVVIVENTLPSKIRKKRVIKVDLEAVVIVVIVWIVFWQLPLSNFF